MSMSFEVCLDLYVTADDLSAEFHGPRHATSVMSFLNLPKNERRTTNLVLKIPQLSPSGKRKLSLPPHIGNTVSAQDRGNPGHLSAKNAGGGGLLNVAYCGAAKATLKSLPDLKNPKYIYSTSFKKV